MARGWPVEHHMFRPTNEGPGRDPSAVIRNAIRANSRLKGGRRAAEAPNLGRSASFSLRLEHVMFLARTRTDLRPAPRIDLLRTRPAGHPRIAGPTTCGCPATRESGAAGRELRVSGPVRRAGTAVCAPGFPGAGNCGCASGSPSAAGTRPVRRAQGFAHSSPRAGLCPVRRARGLRARFAERPAGRHAIRGGLRRFVPDRHLLEQHHERGGDQ